MKSIVGHHYFVLTIRILVGLTFVYAGATKLSDPWSFGDSIASFQVLPKELINIWAIGLPPCEIIVGLMLFFGWKLRAGSFCLLVLTVIFAGALSQALGRGLEIDCGCFGSGKPSVYKTWLSLIRDLFLIAAAAFLYWNSLKIVGDGGLSSAKDRTGSGNAG